MKQKSEQDKHTNKENIDTWIKTEKKKRDLKK